MDKAEKLDLVHDMLQSLHRLNIMYCHWKSNEHLAASMDGTTDLDILFDPKSSLEVEQLLTNCGFKLFVPASQKKYRDIVDFIGLDLQSGKIVHVHAHFRLTLGERYLKGYQLDLEQKLLETRVYDEDFGIYRSAPALELILLYFRYALKIRNRDILKSFFKNDVPYSKYVINEYRWLKSRCNDDEIETLLKNLFADYYTIFELVIREFCFDTLRRLSVVLHKTFSHQRIYSPVKAKFIRWQREMTITTFRRWSQLSGRPIISQRVHPGRGLVVALIGPDGAGKSTVIGNLQNTFKKKIDVYSLYMGRGKSGNASWQRRLLALFKKKYKKYQLPKKEKEATPSSSGHERSFRFNLFRCLEALAVAKERQRKLKMMQAAKAKGMLVICDRFPQNQLMGYNDGPALSYLLHSKNFLFRRWARLEARAYKVSEQNLPDLLFKLVASPDIVAARKPSKSSLEMLQTKIEGIKRLQFLGNCDVVTIDASQPLNDVILPIKRRLWNSWI